MLLNFRAKNSDYFEIALNDNNKRHALTFNRFGFQHLADTPPASSGLTASGPTSAPLIMLRYVLCFIFCIMLFIPPASAASSEPQKTRIIVSGDHDNPPYEHLENGKPSGFNIELIQATAEVLGLDIEVRLGPWHKVRRDLEQGKIDALAGMYYSPDRGKNVEFSVAHTMVSSAIFVRKDSPIRSFEDIRGKEIIVQKSDFIHDFLKERRLASRIVTVTDPGDALRLLAEGKHDCAFMSSRLQGEYFVNKYRLAGLRIVNSDLPPHQYCFAVKRGNQELLDLLNEGLNILRETGRYREIHDKWFGVYEKRTWWETGKYFVFALAAIALMLLASLTWSQSLKSLVNKRTAELRKSEDDLRKAHAELEQRVKQRTSELFYSRQMLQLVLDHIPQRVFWKDRSSIFVGCNTPFAHDSGHDNPDELIGKSDFEMAWAETAELYRADDRQVITTGIPKMNYEEPQHKADGSISWLRTTKVPLRDKDEQIIGMLGMYEDITEWKKAEDAVRESEEKYHAIVDAFDGQIYICSHDYRVEFMNKMMIERTGRDATGELCFKVLHDRDSICPWCVNDRVQQGEIVRWEVKSPKDDRWYYVVNTPIYHVGGTISKQAMIIDITERKQMEEALRVSEEKYRMLINNVNVGVFQTTVDQNGRMLQANPAMSKLTGYTYEELMQLAVANVYHDPESRKQLISELKEKGFVKNREVMLVKKDGTPVWASLSMTVQYDDQGGIQWLNGIGEDVTARKHSEELLAQKSAELERSNKELEHRLHEIEILERERKNIFNMIAHDMKNSITVSSGFTARLLSGKTVNSHHDLELIHDELKTAEDLIANFMKFSKFGIKSCIPVHTRIDIIALLKKRIEGYTVRAERKNIRIALEIVDGIIPDIEADREMIKRVITNLIDNAVKYTDPGGEITVRVSNEKGDIAVRIQDTGIGIAPDEIRHVFDAFYRAKSDRKGSGLGLSIARTIIEAHGGRIWIESTPGKGSTFSFTLPATDAAG